MRVTANNSREEKFTYADYLTWPDENRCEIISGQIYSMSPAPGTAHQETLSKLMYHIMDYLKNGPCKVFAAPFDVRLAEAKETGDCCSNVVQPDISVICDHNKLDEKGCIGAPDWVIEILSPSTSSKDQVKKRYLYEKHGVKEFWLIHPIERTATLYFRKGSSFSLQGIYDDTAILMSKEFKGFSVSLKAILPALKAVKEEADQYHPANKKKTTRK